MPIENAAFEFAGSAFLFIQHCCFFVFVFLHFGRMALSFFGEMCGRVGNDMPR